MKKQEELRIRSEAAEEESHKRLDMANVTDMRMMFTNCCRLKGVKVSNLSVSQVRDGTMAFYDCNSLTGRCRTELRDFGFDL